MGYSYWQIERRRIAAISIGAILAGWISGYWLASFVITLIIYIVWLLIKLQELHNWLGNGGKLKSIPDSSGIWEHIYTHIQVMQKANGQHKKRMAAVLKRTQNIITSLPYATILLTEHNEIEWANKYSSHLLKIDHIRDRGIRLDNLLRVPEIRYLLQHNLEGEVEITSPHDEYTQLTLRLIPVQSNMKLLIARDVSERVRLQQMRKNFIANASHELRTPLTVISGYLETMQDAENFPEHLHPAVAAAVGQSKRMSNIIEDLLTLSRLENSEIRNDKTEILDMASIIEHICSSEINLNCNNQRTNTSLVDTNLKLQGAESEIVSVCSNLIHNAFRYTPAGTTITVIWQKLLSGESRLMVKDQGEGIPAEHLSHLTERFYRVDKGRSQEAGGTGLGLAIVLHIVQRHEGKLNIRSQRGVGSEFEVIFPAQRTFFNSLNEPSARTCLKAGF